MGWAKWPSDEGSRQSPQPGAAVSQVGVYNRPVRDTSISPGGMAERTMAAVLKTANPSRVRGFESHSLRQFLFKVIPAALFGGVLVF